MRAQIERGALLKGYPAIARPLIDDPDNMCRWQALIVVGEYIESEPEMVWRVVVRYGTSDGEDLRAGVACVLLEHLLEHHYWQYIIRVREAARRSTRFAETWRLCWDFGGARKARR